MSHYSRAQKPAELRANTIKTGKILASLTLGRDEELVLVYRGMSGIATATAMSLWWHSTTYKDAKGRGLSMAYVRKDSEVNDCHGDRVETEWSSEHARSRRLNLVFIDDFVSSGESMRKALSGFIAHYQRAPLAVSMVTMVQNNYGTVSLRPKDRHINVEQPTEVDPIAF